MGYSIRDSIVTPYITNLLGKDPNRCQMTRMSCWPSTFVVSFYLFVDEASERKVSTFLIIFRKRFQHSFVSLKANTFFEDFLLASYLVEPEERVPKTNCCPSDGDITPIEEVTSAKSGSALRKTIGLCGWT
jgi:hypothetical protein